MDLKTVLKETLESENMEVAEDDPILEKLQGLFDRMIGKHRRSKLKRRIFFAVKVYVFLFSAVGFSLFIFEESLQTAGFSGFAYSEAEDWRGLETVTIPTQKTILAAYDPFVHNPLVMILNPLMAPAYRAFYLAAEAQIKGNEARVRFQR